MNIKYGNHKRLGDSINYNRKYTIYCKKVESIEMPENLTPEEIEALEEDITKGLSIMALGLDPDEVTPKEYNQLIKTLKKSIFKYRFSKKHRRKK